MARKRSGGLVNVLKMNFSVGVSIYNENVTCVILSATFVLCNYILPYLILISLPLQPPKR